MKQQKSFYYFTHYASFRFLCILAFMANLSAHIGAGTTSSWNKYQPTLPEELSR
ncbi:MAG: cyclic lactone autoinducer peptide [Lachnospiraceae bacterium]|nr:cyclic lactone autoinducer peptide [Lachnospiraceae bacterium]